MAEVIEKVSVEDYLEQELNSDIRHEYLGGEVRAMAGTTLEHEDICNNLIELLRSCLREKGCYLYSGQVRLFTPVCEKAFLYPDIHIYCGTPQKEKLPQGAYALVNPTFIIEILSERTRHFDRVDKFECYQKIPSLKGYLLVESDLDKQSPALHLRTWKDTKSFQEVTYSLEDVLTILGCELKVDKVYDLPQLER